MHVTYLLTLCHFKTNSMHYTRHIYPSLVLVQPRKTCPCLTERLLMGRKESNQTKQKHYTILGEQWLSGRMLDLRSRGHYFETHRRHYVLFPSA